MALCFGIVLITISGWALMVRDRLGRFRGVHLDVSLRSARRAQAGLRLKIAEK